MIVTTPRTPDILEVLEVSYTVYDNYREKHFQAYCQAIAGKFFMSYRVLQSHDYMRNYFADKWIQYVEHPFLINYSDYFPYCEPIMKRKLFAEYTEQLIKDGEVKMYPMPLIREIRKQNLLKMAN